MKTPDGMGEMSYWFYKREKSGNKNLYAVDFPYTAIIPLLGMLAALLFPYFLNPNNLVKSCFYLISAGFFLLLISKVSLFSKRIWNSWGPTHMSKPFRFLYITGYILIGVGVVVVLILLSALTNR
jgi:hypothetical protein